MVVLRSWLAHTTSQGETLKATAVRGRSPALPEAHALGAAGPGPRRHLLPENDGEPGAEV